MAAPDEKSIGGFGHAPFRDKSSPHNFITLPKQRGVVAEVVVLNFYGALLADQIGPRLLRHGVQLFLDLMEA